MKTFSQEHLPTLYTPQEKGMLQIPFLNFSISWNLSSRLFVGYLCALKTISPDIQQAQM